jgi:hypothetical protein
MPLILSGSIDISGSMTATTIVVSAPGAGGIVSSSQQIQNYNTFAVTSSANTFYGNQAINGTLGVTIGGSTELNVQQTGVTLGNVVTDRHMVTGSLSLSGSLGARVGTNENVSIFSVGSGDMRISALNDAASSNVQLSIQASPLIFRTAGGSEVMRMTSGGLAIGGAGNPTQPLVVSKTGASNYLLVSGENNSGYDIAQGFTDGTNTVYSGMMRGSTGLTGAYTIFTGGAARINVASDGQIDTRENLLYSKRTSPSNVNSGATTAFTITQKSGEFQSTYIVSIIGLYDSGGSNQNGFYTGFVTFFTDGAIAQANITAFHSNGWSATAAATTGGSFTVTFTNGAATTMTNVRISALKINAT